MRILLVEDDARISAFVSKGPEGRGNGYEFVLKDRFSSYLDR